jgi:hypothetical protein
MIEHFYANFQLFFSVVVYGLFHGLVFLPVVLSILGPSDSSGPADQVYTVPVQNGSAHLGMAYQKLSLFINLC